MSMIDHTNNNICRRSFGQNIGYEYFTQNNKSWSDNLNNGTFVVGVFEPFQNFEQPCLTYNKISIVGNKSYSMLKISTF